MNNKDIFLLQNAGSFNKEDLVYLEKSIKENNFPAAGTLVKNPTVALILSLTFGGLAVDRFYLGQVPLGILKLLTLGGLGFWAIADWFRIQNITKKENMKQVTNKIVGVNRSTT